MKNFGTIIALDDENALIEVKRSTSCGEKCGSCASNCKNKTMVIGVKNTLNAKIGEKVEVESESKRILSIAFLIYIFPIIMFILGVYLSNLIMGYMGKGINELVSIAVGIVFVVVILLMIRSYDKHNSNPEKYIITMRRNLND